MLGHLGTKRETMLTAQASKEGAPSWAGAGSARKPQGWVCDVHVQTGPAEEELPLLGRWLGEADGRGAHGWEGPLSADWPSAIVRPLGAAGGADRQGLQPPVSQAGWGGRGAETLLITSTAVKETVGHFRIEVSA